MTRSIPRLLAVTLAAVATAACGSSDATGSQIGSETLPSEPVSEPEPDDDPVVTTEDEAWDPADGPGIVTLRPVALCWADGDDPVSTVDFEALRSLTGETCQVGPVAAEGEVFARNSAQVDIDAQTGGWSVSVELRPDGEARWNQIAAECYQMTAGCPSGQLAIVLDDVIQSAPRVNQPSFAGSVQIAGSFTEDEARTLARALNRGAFPVPVEE